MLLFFVAALFVVAAHAQSDGAQSKLTPRIPYDSRVKFGLPRPVWEFLENNAWGDFHLAFHMSRKYYVIGTQGRQWLDRNKIKPAPFQEGDPSNGVEFLAMHRAMIEYLRATFGSLPVNNDPEGRTTVSQVLDGWSTDNQVINGLTKMGLDARTFKAGLANVNNFDQFKSEDEFALFIQTGMRLIGKIDPASPSSRHYTNDERPGAGVHNWMHGQLEDDNSPITVGDPRTNLPNMMFWRIHGWIEAKWKQWEAARPRTADEDQLYQGFITQFRAHMVQMSGGATTTTTTKPASSVATTTTTTTTTAAEDTTTTTKKTKRSTTKRSTTKRTKKPRSGFSLQGLAETVLADEERAFRDLKKLRNDAKRLLARERVSGFLDRIRRNVHSLHGIQVPWELITHLRRNRRWFRNHVWDCHALYQGVSTDTCPDGPLTPDRKDPRKATVPLVLAPPSVSIAPPAPPAPTVLTVAVDAPTPDEVAPPRVTDAPAAEAEKDDAKDDAKDSEEKEDSSD